jgi:hypothetical protein
MDVLYKTEKIQNIKVSINDSTDYYKNLIPGSWTNVWDYDFDNNGIYSFYEEDFITINPGGTALWTSSHYYNGQV